VANPVFDEEYARQVHDDINQTDEMEEED